MLFALDSSAFTADLFQTNPDIEQTSAMLKLKPFQLEKGGVYEI